jgi:hypothetical protein
VNARVLAVDGLPIGFLGRWWRIVAEARDEFHILAVVDTEGVVCGCVAEAVEVGWGCFGGATIQTEDLASSPIGKGFQRYTRALQV